MPGQLRDRRRRSEERASGTRIRPATAKKYLRVAFIEAVRASIVKIEGADREGAGTEAELDVAVPSVDRGTAEALVAKAHEVCPYSNATRGNIDVVLTVV